MMCSLCPMACANNWQMVVLPVPVSPTSKMGSLDCMHAATRAYSRRVLGSHTVPAALIEPNAGAPPGAPASRRSYKASGSTATRGSSLQSTCATGPSVGPPEQVAWRDEAGTAGEDARTGAAALQLLHDADHRLAEGRRQLRAPFQDGDELWLRDLIHLHLEEAIAKGSREHLPPPVCPWWILGGKEHEARMGRERFRRLGDEKLAVVIEQPVERLEHFALCEVELIQYDPVTVTNSLSERAIVKDEPAVRIRLEGADILLHVGMLMVVDAHQPMASPAREPLDHRRFSR
eukprot:scaffold69076_cov30-Tisochrysis_lutea.AAC.1